MLMVDHSPGSAMLRTRSACHNAVNSNVRTRLMRIVVLVLATTLLCSSASGMTPTQNSKQRTFSSSPLPGRAHSLSAITRRRTIEMDKRFIAPTAMDVTTLLNQVSPCLGEASMLQLEWLMSFAHLLSEGDDNKQSSAITMAMPHGSHILDIPMTTGSAKKAAQQPAKALDNLVGEDKPSLRVGERLSTGAVASSAAVLSQRVETRDAPWARADCNANNAVLGNAGMCVGEKDLTGTCGIIGDGSGAFEDYENGMNCSWWVRATNEDGTPATSMRISFEGTTEDYFDKLTLFAGGTLLMGKYSGPNGLDSCNEGLCLERELLFQIFLEPIIYANFVSDSVIEEEGWNMTWEATTAPVTPFVLCTNTHSLTGSSGTIRFGDISRGTEFVVVQPCTYRIQPEMAANGNSTVRSIRLRFISMFLPKERTNGVTVETSISYSRKVQIGTYTGDSLQSATCIDSHYPECPSVTSDIVISERAAIALDKFATSAIGFTLEWEALDTPPPIQIADEDGDPAERAVMTLLAAAWAPVTTSWNPTNRLRNWWGVSVNELGYISRVSIQNSAKSQYHANPPDPVTIPTELAQLRYLKKLEIRWLPKLVGSIPASFNTLPAFEELSLDHTGIDDITIVSSLSRLSKLSVTNCPELNGTLPDITGLSHLSEINIANTAFSGPLFDMTGQQQSLRVLNVAHNMLDGTIPSSLFSIPTLESVRLEHNRFSGMFPTVTTVASNLNVLQLSHNEFTGPLASVGNAKTVRCSFNRFVGQLPCHWNESMVEFDASNNLFNGTMCNDLERVLKLKFLRIDNNLISATLPAALGQHLSLKTLDMSHNAFSGPLFEVSNETELTDVDLSYNQLQGAIPESWSMMPKVKTISLARNSLALLPSRFPGALSVQKLFLQQNLFTRFPMNMSVPLPHLEELDLSSNAIEGGLPKTMPVPKLQKLLLSTNKLGGEILDSFFKDLVNLEVLLLDQNSFKGPIPPSVSTLPKLQHIDVSANVLTGTLRFEGLAELQTIVASNNKFLQLDRSILNLPELRELLIDGNDFSGELPEFSRLLKLQKLNVANNRFTGYLTRTPVTLLELDVSRNAITGFAPDFQTGNDLKTFVAGRNQLRGTIPPSAHSSLLLEMLDLSNNELTGPLPDLSESRVLHTFKCSNNKLGGALSALGDLSIATLEAGDNQITGPLSSNVCSPKLRKLHLNRNLLVSSISPEFTAACFLVNDLDLQVNKLTGSIPVSLSDIEGLEFLDLSGNELSGPIHPNFAQFSILKSLNLQGNTELTGEFPKEIWTLEQIERVAIRETGLTGTIDRPLIRSTLTEVALKPTPKPQTPETKKLDLKVECPKFEIQGNRPQMEVDPLFFQFKDCFCLPNTYGKNGKCFLECPFGGNCENGTQLRSKRGFWCDPNVYAAVEEIDACLLCPSGYCCEEEKDQTSCPVQEHCSGNHDGVLCGGCIDGYSAAIGTSACLPDSECTSWKWFIPLVTIGPVFIPIVFIVAYKPLNDLWVLPFKIECVGSVVLFFYQVAPLFIGPLPRQLLAERFNAMIGVFNMELGTGSGSDGICVLPGFGPVGKEALNFVLPVMMVFWIVVIAIFLRFYNKMKFRTLRTRLPGPHQRRPYSFGGVIRALLVLMEVAYSTTLQSTFTLLLCVDVQDEEEPRRLFIDGTYACWTTWQYLLGIVCVPLVLYPFILIAIARKVKRGASPVSRAVWENLCAPYKNERRIYAATLLWRRLLLIVIFTAGSVIARAFGLFLASFSILILDVMASPMRHQVARVVSVILEAMLVILASCNLLFAVQEQGGIDPTDDARRYSLLMMSTIILPLSVLPLMLLWYKLLKYPVQARFRKFGPLIHRYADSTGNTTVKAMLLSSLAGGTFSIPKPTHRPDVHPARSAWLQARWCEWSLRMVALDHGVGPSQLYAITDCTEESNTQSHSQIGTAARTQISGGSVDGDGLEHVAMPSESAVVPLQEHSVGGVAIRKKATVGVVGARHVHPSHESRSIIDERLHADDASHFTDQYSMHPAMMEMEPVHARSSSGPGHSTSDEEDFDRPPPVASGVGSAPLLTSDDTETLDMYELLSRGAQHFSYC